MRPFRLPPHTWCSLISHRASHQPSTWRALRALVTLSQVQEIRGPAMGTSRSVSQTAVRSPLLSRPHRQHKPRSRRVLSQYRSSVSTRLPLSSPDHHKSMVQPNGSVWTQRMSCRTRVRKKPPQPGSHLADTRRQCRRHREGQWESSLHCTDAQVPTVSASSSCTESCRVRNSPSLLGAPLSLADNT